MQYYYAQPGQTQTLSGVKEEAAKFVEKIRGAFSKLSLGDRQLDETQKKLDELEPFIQALGPGPDQNEAAAAWQEWTNVVSAFRPRLEQVKADLYRVWDELKKVLGISGMGAVGQLGVVWFIVVGLVAAALLAAGKLWDEIVNKTREINIKAAALKATIEGKLPPEVLRDLTKGKAEGFMAWLPKIAIAAVVLFALPGLMKARRRSAA